MAKDYKAYSNKSKSSSGSKSKVKIIIWIIVAIALVLGFIKILHELSNKTAKIEEVAPAEKIIPQKKVEEKQPKVKFEFYNMLPKDQVTTSEQALVSEAKPPVQVAPIAPSNPAVTISIAGNYIIQAGSVRAMSDAEALKAKLVLLGFDASIQKTVAQGVTWYRVNIGPVATKDDALAVQTNLRKNNIDSLVKKVTS